jgi:valyl-tRNA synthetase
VLPPEKLEHPPATIEIDGTEVKVPPDSFTLKFSYMEEGAKVDVLSVGGVIVTIGKPA